MSTTYVKQYERVKRWYDRFSALNNGRTHDSFSENYVDDIYAFFQNSYHLKDWIKNDSAVPVAIQNAVEPYITSTRCLRLCADICNSSKHLSLTNPRSNEAPAFGAKHYGLNLGAGSQKIQLKWEVDTSNGPIDAFQLARECIDAWEVFLTSNGLK